MSKSKSALSTAGLKNVHGRAIKLSAWVVYVLAIATSTLLVGTFVADWYRDIIGMLPAGWRIGFAVIAATVMVILAFIDVVKDLEPNLNAVYCTLALPTVVSVISGGFAGWITGGADKVFSLVDQQLSAAVPNGMGLGNDLFAIALTVAVVMLAQRFNRKG